jgi:hypothetical protein
MKPKRCSLTARLASENPVVRRADRRPGLDERAEADLAKILSLPPTTVGADTEAPRRRVVFRAWRVALVGASVVVLAASGIAAASQLGLFDFREFPPPADVQGEAIRTGPRWVIASGSTDRLGWRLIAYRSSKGVCVGLEFAGESRAASTTCGTSTLKGDVAFPTADYLGLGTNRTWFYGPVSTRATRVALTLVDGRTLLAKVFPSPKGFALGHGLYLTSVDGQAATADRGNQPVAVVAAYDEAGEVIARLRR